MKQKMKPIIAFGLMCSMVVLILDAKTAAAAVQEALNLCIKTVIPSLFPFMVISAMFNSLRLQSAASFLRPVCSLCGIPAGCEGLLLTGLLGGYPVGAALVTNAYEQGAFKKETAHRLLGFCSNAGPSFIFGLLSSFFTSGKIIWCIWAIHIISALLTGIVLPKRHRQMSCTFCCQSQSLSNTLKKSVQTMAMICSWVILFRVMIAYFQRWFLALLPHTVKILLSGTLELTNGCCSLYEIPSESLRFLIANILVAGGGFCVFLQTVSVTQPVGLGYYARGKILQILFSILLTVLAAPLLSFDVSEYPVLLLPIAGLILIVALMLLYRKKQ